MAKKKKVKKQSVRKERDTLMRYSTNYHKCQTLMNSLTVSVCSHLESEINLSGFIAD